MNTTTNDSSHRYRKAYRERSIPEAPLGFTQAVMADIHLTIDAGNAALESFLPRFAMVGMVAASLAIVYGMAILDKVPTALAAMYIPSALGF
ncbi:MAG: hypothetical protein KKB70_11250 [Proteobacteria bacterium]|nr:hypothetical protein [Pseudomonadota bacterium]MBU1611780.1 hypothetical protein [Pseudomonadota bacterium]